MLKTNETEIQNYYTNNPLGLEDNLEVLYDFRSGSDTILYDITGNTNHGIIHGASWVENIEGCTDNLACNHNSEAYI